MAEAKSSNYFGSFLDAVKATPEVEERSEPAAPMRLLQVLETKGPQSATGLQGELGIDFLAYSKALEAMTDAKLVQIVGEPSHEVVTLTDAGHTLASVNVGLSS